MTMAISQVPTLLNEKQAAAFLGVSVKTLQSWRFLRKGPPYIKMGAAVRYQQAGLDQYVRGCCIRPGFAGCDA